MTDIRTPAGRKDAPYKARDEIALILACSRSSRSGDTRETIVHLLKKELDWASVFRYAEKHRLIPLLYYNLKNTAPAYVPAAILQQMNEIYLFSMKQSMVQIRELFRIIQLGKDHGIPIIPYKGAALSQQVYGDIGLRVSSDIDILVRRQDVPAVKTLLHAQGYTSRLSLTPEQEKKYIQVRCEDDLFHPLKTTIDVHWQFIPYYYLAPFPETDIWSQLKVISLEGEEIPALSPELLIIALCIHGAKHQWKELRHIGDLAGIIAAEHTIDWERVLHIAQEKRIERIISLGLRLAEELMHTDLPPFVSKAIRRDRVTEQMLSSAIDMIFSNELRPGGDIREVLYWVSVRECVWDKIRVISLLLFKPNHDDWAYIPLPGILSPFYYVIRPIRLAFAYGVKR